jgi:hypothetical protein
LLALLASLVAFGSFSIAMRAADGSPVGTAVLDLDGTAYRFSATTCAIADSGFLAGGSGQVDGEDFWVTVSPDAARLTLGSSEPSTRSVDDLQRLSSTGEIPWRRTDDTVSADLVMEDGRDLRPRRLQGHLTLTCAPA